MWNESQAFKAYAAYGADLIRTGGIIAGATPSVIFRATVLFQRFEAVVNATFRAHYYTPTEMATLHALRDARSDSSFFPSSSISDTEESVHDVNSSPRTTPTPEVEEKERTGTETGRRVEYILPEHVASEAHTHAVALRDLLAPLDYCIHNINAHDDICLLAAACLLITAKLEQPYVTLRCLTDVFLSLSTRRLPSAAPAELAVANTRGGRLGRDYAEPKQAAFKSSIISAEELVLHLLGFQTFVDSPYKYCQVFLSLIVEDAQASPGYVQWLQRAVHWLNDAPRSPELAMATAPSLAAVAILQATPAAVVLPPRWFAALGASAEECARVQRTYDSCFHSEWTQSAAAAIEAIRAGMPTPRYVTLEQWGLLQADLVSSSSSASPSSPSSTTPEEPVEVCSTVVGEPAPVVTGLEELEKRQFVDMRELRRQKQLEEKARELELEKKRATEPKEQADKERANAQNEKRKRKASSSPPRTGNAVTHQNHDRTDKYNRGRDHHRSRDKRSRSPSDRRRSDQKSSSSRGKYRRQESPRIHRDKRR